MKFLSFSLFIFLLISINFCEEIVNNSIEETPVDKESLSDKVYDYLSGLHIENMKTMTKEELLKIFETLFTIGLSEIKLDQKTKESNLSLIRIFAEQIFNLLETKEKNIIEVDKIMNYFNPKNISKYINMILKALGLDELIDTIGKPLFSILNEWISNNEKSSEL